MTLEISNCSSFKVCIAKWMWCVLFYSRTLYNWKQHTSHKQLLFLHRVPYPWLSRAIVWHIKTQENWQKQWWSRLLLQGRHIRHFWVRNIRKYDFVIWRATAAIYLCHVTSFGNIHFWTNPIWKKTDFGRFIMNILRIKRIWIIFWSIRFDSIRCRHSTAAVTHILNKFIGIFVIRLFSSAPMRNVDWSHNSK